MIRPPALRRRVFILWIVRNACIRDSYGTGEDEDRSARRHSRQGRRNTACVHRPQRAQALAQPLSGGYPQSAQGRVADAERRMHPAVWHVFLNAIELAGAVGQNGLSARARQTRASRV